MSAFQIYALILVIIYIVYYMMAILWELKYHSPKPAAPKYDPRSIFGFKQVFVFENFDGTYSLSEDSCRPSEDYHFNNEDDGIFESLEDNLDFTPVEEPPEEVGFPIEGVDDDPEAFAVYERIKQEQEKIGLDLLLAEHPEPEEGPTLFERLLEAQNEMISAVEGLEAYYSKEFLYVMNLPIDINTRVKRQKVPYNPLKLSSNDNYYDYQLDDWLHYSRVDFSFSEDYCNILIHLHINKHTYTKVLRPADVKKIFISDRDEKFILNLDTWWRRKEIAMSCFKEEIIYEHKMVDSGVSCNYGRDAHFEPRDIDIRYVAVPELWFDLTKCVVLRTGYNQYRIQAFIRNNPALSAVISDKDVDIYLQRNEDGWYIRKVSPEQLMVKYLMYDIASDMPKHGSGIEAVKDYTFGHEPIFLYDEQLVMSDEEKREAFTGTTKIVFDETRRQDPYILDTYIYGFHCSMKMRMDFVFNEILRLNEKFETVPKMDLEDLAVRFWGHEFYYLKNGSEPEPVSNLVEGYGDSKPKALPRDFQVLEYPDPSIIKVLRIYSRDKNLRRFGDSYSLSFCIGGWYYRHNPSLVDICNYLERDAYGKFTRRVSLESLTAKYAERYAVMVRMYEEGIPKTVIAKTFGEADYSVNKLINSLDIKKPKTHVSEIPQKKRQLIRDEFAKGLSLTELKTKYKVRDYGSLYKILGNAAVGSNYKIPDEYQKYKKEKEEGN